VPAGRFGRTGRIRVSSRPSGPTAVNGPPVGQPGRQSRPSRESTPNSQTETANSAADANTTQPMSQPLLRAPLPLSMQPAVVQDK
jgi:hypothetical protein